MPLRQIQELLPDQLMFVADRPLVIQLPVLHLLLLTEHGLYLQAQQFYQDKEQDPLPLLLEVQQDRFAARLTTPAEPVLQVASPLR